MESWNAEKWSRRGCDFVSGWLECRAEMVKGCKGALRGGGEGGGYQRNNMQFKKKQNFFRPFLFFPTTQNDLSESCTFVATDSFFPTEQNQNPWGYWVMRWGDEESYLAHENVLGAGWWWVCLTAPLGHNKVNSCHFQSLQAATANHSKGYFSMSEGLSANFNQSDGKPNSLSIHSAGI